jgi:tetratricopeptide (TPR) repeat protein
MVAPISVEERDLANQHLDRSISFAMCGKIDQAITEAKKAVEIDPDFSQAYNKLGDYYLKKGQVNEAIDVYRKSIVLNPDNENSHFDLGRSLAMVGKYDEALECLNKALDLNPDHGETYCHTGLVYIELGDPERAITNLETALQHDRENVMANYLLAIAKQKVGKENEAYTVFKNVIDRYTTLTKVKGNFAEGYYYIGKSHFYMGELNKALENLKKAVEFDTEAVDYHYSFGMLYSDADAFFALAEVLYALDDNTEAIANLKNALNLDPQNKKYQELKSKLGL